MKRIGVKEILLVIHAYGRYTINPKQLASLDRLELCEKLYADGSLRRRKVSKNQWEYFKGETS